LDKGYIDTNVFIYSFYSKDKPDFTIKSQKILKKVKTGVFQGYISFLVIMEIINVLRRFFFKYEKMKIDEINDKIDTILTKIFAIPNLEIVKNIDGIIGNFISESFIIMYNNHGMILRNKYKKLDPIDIMHFIIAKKLDCNIICSNDKGFKNLDAKIKIKF